MEQGQLPAGWEAVSLCDIADVGAGSPAPQGKDKFSPNGVPFVRVQDMGRLSGQKLLRDTKDRVNETGSVNLRLHKRGTVLLTKSGASTLLNQRAVLHQDSYVVSHIATVSASSVTFSDWLYYYLTSVDVATLAHGGNMPSLPLSRIRSIQAPLPPLNEQHRIVEKIETLFARLDKGEAALREVQKLLTRYRQSVLKAAVTGQLTADWRAENAHRLEHGRDLLERILQTRRENWQGRGNYKEPVTPDTTDLPELPEGWVWASTEQVVSVQTGATPKKGDAEYYADGSVPWITSTAVNEDLIVSPQAYITETAIRETNAKVFPRGSLIVAMYGEGKTRGKISELGIDAATNQACAAFIVEYLPESLKHYLRRFYQYNYEAIRLLSSGGVQPNLNLGLVKSTPVPLPPEPEVVEILDRLDVEMRRVAAISNLCKTELTRSTSLRQSILKDAFAGRLVPQDPEDEPAADLLARIRVDREAAPRKKATRKKAKT